MRRREFIALLGGAAAWPVAAQAEQQPERTRRIGVLMNLAADDAESQRRMKAFVQQLQDLKWVDGRNVQLGTRWGAGDADRFRRYAAELVALGPDVILAVGSTTTGPLLQATRTILVVFAQVIDPVGGGPGRTHSAEQPVMSIVSSEARSLPTSRCKRRRSTS